MNPELEQLAQRAVGALLNGLYQSLLLLFVLGLGLKLMRGTNAATRHAVGFVALILIASLPVLHFLVPGAEPVAGDSGAREHPTDAFNPTLGQPVSAVTVGEAASATAPVTMGEPDEPARAVSLETALVVPAPVEESTVPDQAAWRSIPFQTRDPFSEPASTRADPGDARLRGESIEPVPAGSATTTGSSGLRFPPPVRLWRTEVPGILSLMVLVVVGAIAVVRVLRLGRQLLILWRLKRSAVPPGAELTASFLMLQHELKLVRPVRLLVSERITTPMAVGFFRPAVLLPAVFADGSGRRGIEGILRHELAHIQRRDDWCNLLQQVIAAIHFFNPAVVWLSQRLTIEREVACDDFALAKSASRRDYALLLAEFAGRNRDREWIAAPAAWSNRSQLKERINMILDPKRNTSRQLARTSAGALTVATLATAAAALIAGPRLVLADPADETSPPRSSGDSAVTLTSPTGDSLVAHVDEARSGGTVIGLTADGTKTGSWGAGADGVTIVAPDRVEWNVDHDVTTTLVLPAEPDVLVSAQPVIKVTPPTAKIVGGSSGVIVAHGAPAPAEDADELRPPKAPKPARVPRKAVPPDVAPPPAPNRSEESLERRLERLEQRLEQLAGGERKFRVELPPGKEMEIKRFEWNGDLKGEPFVWNVPDAKSPDWPFSEEQRKALEKSIKASEQEVARAMKEAQREFERAHQDAERAQRDVELRAELDIKQERSRASRDVDTQRKALQSQRRSLEREMENLNRHIERLEQQLEKLDEQMDQLDGETERREESQESDEAVESLPRVKEKEAAH